MKLITMRATSGLIQRIRQAAKSRGMSLSAYMRTAAIEKMERDDG